MRWLTLLFFLGGFTLQTPAHASTGGPDVSTLLGYEARTGKIYYAVTSYSEGPGTEIYSIAADSLGRSVPLLYPRPYFPNDMEATERWTKSTLDSLRKHLVQPDTLPRARARMATKILGVWMYAASSDYSRCAEYLVDLNLSILALSGCSAVTTFCIPDIRLGEIFLLPGGTRAVARVVYTGIPYEVCYDADHFVLLSLRKPSHTQR